MALLAGYEIKWDGISDSAMKKASIDGHEGNLESMRKLIQIYIGPSSILDSQLDISNIKISKRKP